jgi:NADH-quinone oxidoreductase subunit H
VLAISIISLVELIAPGTFSLGEALSRYLSLSSNGISSVAKIMSYILACLSFGLTLFSKLSLKPLDISEAETEIAGGLVSELSGPLLSLYILIHEAELTLMFYIFSSMIIPYNGIGLPFLFLSITKYFAVVGVITVLSYSFGRVKIDQAIKILLRLGLPLSLISFTIAIML